MLCKFCNKIYGSISRCVQNHHADNSFDFVTSVFLKIDLVWFSTVRLEMNNLLAICFFDLPQAIISQICSSLLESVAVKFI